MQLNITTDYAIRTVLYLATKGNTVSTTEIANNMEIPRPTVTKIISKLKSKGFVTVSNGTMGGAHLCVDAEKISLYDILTLMEDGIKLNRCLENDGYCSRNGVGTCHVHDYYVSLQECFEKNLKEITIAKLLST